jgi:hypothetical protein
MRKSPHSGKWWTGINVLEAFEKEDVDGEKPKRRLEMLSTMIEPSVYFDG